MYSLSIPASQVTPIQWFQIIHIYYLEVSAGQEFRIGLVMSFMILVFHDIRLRYLNQAAFTCRYEKCRTWFQDNSLTQLFFGHLSSWPDNCSGALGYGFSIRQLVFEDLLFGFFQNNLSESKSIAMIFLVNYLQKLNTIIPKYSIGFTRSYNLLWRTMEGNRAPKDGVH